MAGVDLSRLSDEDLFALKAGDLTKMSDDGLMLLKGEPKPTPFVPSGEKPSPSWTDPEMLAGNPVTRFALGAAAPIIGAVQTWENINPVSRALGTDKMVNDHLAELERLKQAGRAQIGSEGFDWTEAAGTAFSPALIKAAQAIGVAPTYVQKILQGSALGGAAGLTTPVTDGGENFAETKADQMQAGAVVGGAIPAVGVPLVKAGKGLYHAAIEPLVDTAAIKGRAFLEAAGDKSDEIIALLRQNKEIVPGSKPTAGEAAVPAGRAEFSAFQRSAESVRPSDYVARADEQNAARLASLRTVGKDKAALDSAEAARNATAQKMYGAAYQQAISRDPELTQMSQNPYFKDAIGDAFKLARAKGINPKTDLTQFLHYVKIGLDKQLSRTGDTALSNTEQQAVQQLKTQLVDWMGRQNPAYEAARARFAADSAPINQMQVGQQLEKKLVPALFDEARQSATQFANAVREAPGTIKRATGQSRFYELGDVLTPQQLQVVQGVQDDLARLSRFSDLSKAGAKAGPNAMDVASRSMEQAFGGKVPGMLERGVLIANSIINRLEGKINAKLAHEIAAEMLNPPAVAESMQKALARQRANAALAEAIGRRTKVGIATAGQEAAKEQNKKNKN